MTSRFSIYACTALVLAIVSLSSSVTQSRPAEEETSPLRIVSSFVWVPARVSSKTGEALSHVDVSRLELLDNGHPEKLTQLDTEGLPVSLAILMQTGGSARRFLSSYANLPWLIGQLVGDSIHEITFVTFDSHVEQIWHFPTRTDGATYAMTHQAPGDDGAAIKDAIAFGVQQLEGEPGRFRRVVILLSQESDEGSSTSSRSLLEQLGDSTTVIYSLTIPSGTKPMPLHQEKSTDSIERFAERTEQALSGQTAAEAAHLTGGSNHRFDDQSSLNSEMLATLSEYRNEIILGFQPSRHDPGLHRIEVREGSSKLKMIARRAYWSAVTK